MAWQFAVSTPIVFFFELLVDDPWLHVPIELRLVVILYFCLFYFSFTLWSPISINISAHPMFCYPIICSYGRNANMCWGLNSHCFPIVGMIIL